MIPLLLFVLGAALTPPTLALLARRLPKSTNYRGRPIPTSAGLTLMPIILLTLVLTLWGVAPTGSGGVAFLAYSALVCLVGFADDLWGGVGDRGFAGHLGALLRGRLTTGLVKVAVFGGGALAVAAVIYGVGWRAVVGGALLAGSVNLANLFDVRPGRAIKFVGLAILGLAFAAPAWAVVSAAGVAGGFVGLFYFDVQGAYHGRRCGSCDPWRGHGVFDPGRRTRDVVGVGRYGDPGPHGGCGVLVHLPARGGGKAIAEARSLGAWFG